MYSRCGSYSGFMSHDFVKPIIIGTALCCVARVVDVGCMRVLHASIVWQRPGYRNQQPFSHYPLLATMQGINIVDKTFGDWRLSFV